MSEEDSYDMIESYDFIESDTEDRNVDLMKESKNLIHKIRSNVSKIDKEDREKCNGYLEIMKELLDFIPKEEFENFYKDLENVKEHSSSNPDEIKVDIKKLISKIVSIVIRSYGDSMSKEKQDEMENRINGRQDTIELGKKIAGDHNIQNYETIVDGELDRWKEEHEFYTDSNNIRALDNNDKKIRKANSRICHLQQKERKFREIKSEQEKIIKMMSSAMKSMYKAKSDKNLTKEKRETIMDDFKIDYSALCAFYHKQDWEDINIEQWKEIMKDSAQITYQEDLGILDIRFAHSALDQLISSVRDKKLPMDIKHISMQKMKISPKPKKKEKVHEEESKADHESEHNSDSDSDDDDNVNIDDRTVELDNIEIQEKEDAQEDDEYSSDESEDMVQEDECKQVDLEKVSLVPFIKILPETLESFSYISNIKDDLDSLFNFKTFIKNLISLGVKDLGFSKIDFSSEDGFNQNKKCFEELFQEIPENNKVRYIKFNDCHSIENIVGVFKYLPMVSCVSLTQCRLDSTKTGFVLEVLRNFAGDGRKLHTLNLNYNSFTDKDCDYMEEKIKQQNLSVGQINVYNNKLQNRKYGVGDRLFYF